MSESGRGGIVTTILMQADDRAAEVGSDPGRAIFVGGPLDGKDRHLEELPGSLVIDGAPYDRSVRCADDGVVRYVFRA